MATTQSRTRRKASTSGRRKPATASASTTKALSAKQAAVTVLKKEGGPLKVTQIVERVLATKGVALKGKTPAATIAAILSTENSKTDGLFVRTEAGTYALRDAAKAKAATA